MNREPRLQAVSPLRLIALFEALKGVLVLLAGSGVLTLLHKDVHALAASLVAHAHLNPASHYPRIFIDAAASLDDRHLMLLAAGAAAYGVLRLAEGWGLYFDRAWAELLAAASGAIYVPFELAEVLTRGSALAIALFIANLAVVAVMVRALLRRRRRIDDNRA